MMHMGHLAAALCAGAVLAGTSAVAEEATASELEALSGTFASAGVEEWYGGYGTREFVFRDGQWTLIFTHALDPGMTMRTFQFRTGGGYAVGEPSDAVPGTFRTVFDEDWKHLTRLTDDPAIVEAFGLASCDLPLNLEADISETGCAGWRPVADCGQDHDLFGMTPEGGLLFGVRPMDNDMCAPDRTPTAVLPAVVAR